MAQADQPELLMRLGIDHGSLKDCQRCGGSLERVTGTDPDKCDELGGFKEEYQCNRCSNTGTYRYRYADGKETYQGVCADYSHDL